MLRCCHGKAPCTRGSSTCLLPTMIRMLDGTLRKKGVGYASIFDRHIRAGQALVQRPLAARGRTALPVEAGRRGRHRSRHGLRRNQRAGDGGDQGASHSLYIASPAVAEPGARPSRIPLAAIRPGRRRGSGDAGGMRPRRPGQIEARAEQLRTASRQSMGTVPPLTRRSRISSARPPLAASSVEAGRGSGDASRNPGRSGRAIRLPAAGPSGRRRGSGDGE